MKNAIMRNILKNNILWSLKLISKFRIFTLGAGRPTVHRSVKMDTRKNLKQIFEK